MLNLNKIRFYTSLSTKHFNYTKHQNFSILSSLLGSKNKSKEPNSPNLSNEAFNQAYELYKSIIGFDENSLKKSSFKLNGNQLDIHQNILDKLNLKIEDDHHKAYTIYKSNTKFLKLFLFKFFLIGLSAASYMYLYNNYTGSLFSYSLYILNTVFILTILNFPRLKLRKYVTKINLSRDLKSVDFYIRGRKRIINMNVENIILNKKLNPDATDMLGDDKRTFVMVDLKSKNYLIPLAGAEIDSIDLLSLVLKGYNLNLISIRILKSSEKTYAWRDQKGSGGTWPR